MSGIENWFGRGANRRRPDRREPLLRVRARSAGPRGDRMQRTAAIVVVAAILAGVGWLFLSGARWAGRILLTENPRYTIREFDLGSDGRIRPALIRQTIGVPDGANLFAVDIHRLRAELGRWSWVRHATVSRQLPDRLVVRLTERTPLARILAPGGALGMAVDAEGVVVGPAPSPSALPLIDGMAATGVRPGAVLDGGPVADALDLLELCDATRLGQHVRIATIYVNDPETLDVRLADGERAILPRKDLDAKLRRLSAMLITIRDRRLAPDPAAVVIDLTTDSSFPAAGVRGLP
jgi:cell division protein FtsQ